MTSPANLFGPLVTRNDVELAVKTTLLEHMGPWLAEIDRRHPALPSALPMPRSWQMVDALTEEPLDSTPAVVIAYREGELSEGNEQMRAVFEGGIAVFTEAGAPVEGISTTAVEQSRWLAGVYLGVIVAVLAQHRDLGGLATRTELGRFSARDTGPSSDGNTQYAAGRLRADVHVDGILDPFAGPSGIYAPVTSPPGDLLPVETVEITATADQT